MCLKVGAGGVPAAAQALLMEPATWAYVAAGALALAGRQLTPTVRHSVCFAGWLGCRFVPGVLKRWGKRCMCCLGIPRP